VASDAFDTCTVVWCPVSCIVDRIPTTCHRQRLNHSLASPRSCPVDWLHLPRISGYFLQPKAALLKEGKFDVCVLALPRLIYGDEYNDDILAHHIDLFWNGRGPTEKRLDYVAQRLQVSRGCLDEHKSDGNHYLCDNFSSNAKTESIKQSTALQVVPPWLVRRSE